MDPGHSLVPPVPCWSLLPPVVWRSMALRLDLPSLRAFMLGCKVFTESLRPAAEFRSAWLDNLKRVFPRDPVLQERELSSPGQDQAPIKSLALTLGGTKAVTSQRSQLYMWDLITGTATPLLPSHTYNISCLTASPTGQCAVSGGWGIQDTAAELWVWDLESGQRKAKLEGHVDTVTAVCVTSCDQRAVSGSHDATLRLWNLEGGTCTAVLQGHEDSVLDVQLAPDGFRAVSVSMDATMRVWDLDSCTCTAVLQAPGSAHPVQLAMSADGSSAVCAFTIMPQLITRLLVWDLSSGECSMEVEDFPCAVCCLQAGEVVLGSRDGIIKVWDTQSGVWRAVLPAHGGSPVTCLAARPGSLESGFVSGNEQYRALFVWGVGDEGSWQCKRVLQGHEGGISCLAMSPGGRYVVCESGHGRLRVWDLGARGV